MIQTLDKYGFTRDSAIWWGVAFSGAAAFALENFGLLQQAMPFLGPRAHAWIQLLSAASSALALYLRASPLAQHGTLGTVPNPDQTLTITGKQN